MVVVKRKGTGFDALPLIQPSDSAQWHSPYAVSAEHRRSNSQPPRIGATFRGWKSPVVKMLSFESTTSSSSYYPSSHAGIKESNWLIKIVYAAAAVSWVALRIRSVDYFSMSAALEKDSFAINAQMQHMLVDIEIIEKIVSQEKQLLKNLNQTRTALEHEIRMIKEAEPSNAPKPYSKSEDTINDWLINRQNILLTKIKYLQRYVQASSRATVLDR